LALKKLSINKEQAEQVKELLDEGYSTCKIAKELKLPQAKIWRNVQVMGLGWKIAKHEKTEPQSEYFRWKDFKNKLLI